MTESGKRAAAPARRKKRGGSNLPVVIGLVVGIHLLMGGGLYALTQTDAGQEFIRVHKIKFLAPEQEKQDEAKAPEPPPPPPPQLEQKLETPSVASAPAPTTSSPGVAIGGSGGLNWSGGKFIGGGLEDGPIGAFHAGVLGRVRSCFGDWPGPSQPAEVALEVGHDGQVVSYKLVRGTGLGAEDEHLLEAVRCVQKKGVSAPPEGAGRVVTLRLRPSGGLISGRG